MKNAINQFASITVTDTKGYKKGIPLGQIKYWSESKIEIKAESKSVWKDITIVYLVGDGWRIDVDMPFSDFERLYWGASK